MAASFRPSGAFGAAFGGAPTDQRRAAQVALVEKAADNPLLCACHRRAVADCPLLDDSPPPLEPGPWDCGWCFEPTGDDRRVVAGEAFHGPCWDVRNGRVDIPAVLEAVVA